MLKDPAPKTNSLATPPKSKSASQTPLWQDPWANWAPDFQIQSKKKKSAKKMQSPPQNPKPIESHASKTASSSLPLPPALATPLLTTPLATTTPHAFQEKHSATRVLKKPKMTPVFASENLAQKTISYTKPQDPITRRRILDARLWDNLTPHEQEAAMLIDKAYTAITSGLGFTTSDPSRIPQGKGQTRSRDYVGAPLIRYMTWAREAQVQKLDHASAIDILVFGKTCKAVDRDRRARGGGTAKKNLIACLALFCKLQGWPTRNF